MFAIRNMQSIAIVSAALCCFAGAGSGAEPNVSYAATGVFATPAVSGKDTFNFAGQPFTLTFVLNEATKPTRHSETKAEYSNITVMLEVRDGGTGLTHKFEVLGVSLFLAVGPPGTPDWIYLAFPFDYAGLNLTVRANVAMPAGTIATPAIRPFAAPVALTPRDTATYACPACPPPYTGNSTTLAIAGGTLSATEQ